MITGQQNVLCTKALVLCALVAVILSLSYNTSISAHRSDVVSGQVNNESDKLLDLFYSADWTNARQMISRLKRKNPVDPFPFFIESMIPFWEYFFGGHSTDSAERFLDLSADAIRVAEQRLLTEPTDTASILMLSGLHGYRSLVASREKRYRIAMSSGYTGYSYTRTMMAMNNEDPNTLMGQGVYHYMAGSIPSEVRWMARLMGISGDKRFGFELLERAASSESYVSVDAAMFLAWLYEQEGEADKAIFHLRRMTDRYPTNPIFHYNLARLLADQGEDTLAAGSFSQVVSLNNQYLTKLSDLSKEQMGLLKINRN